MISMYPVCFLHKNSGYSVIFPDLNGLTTEGDTFKEAMEIAMDCLANYLYNCQMERKFIQEPSNPLDIDLHSIAKAFELNVSLQESLVNMVCVDVDAYAKEHYPLEL